MVFLFSSEPFYIFFLCQNIPCPQSAGTERPRGQVRPRERVLKENGSSPGEVWLDGP